MINILKIKKFLRRSIFGDSTIDGKLIGNENNIVFYTDEENNINIEVILQNENVWLNTQSIAKLFHVQRADVTKHINKIYKDEELEETSTCSKWNKFKEKAIETLQEAFRIII